jgi:hypothetical protein
MDKAGTLITFDAVAKEAKVSRSWLYNQPDLRAEVEHLRARRNPTPNGGPVPDRQRAADASLLRRLKSTAERIRRPESENQQLREAPDWQIVHETFESITDNSGWMTKNLSEYAQVGRFDRRFGSSIDH